jgi:HEAT repeat protein
MTVNTLTEFDDLLVHVIERDPARQTYTVKLELEDGRNFEGQMDLEDYRDLVDPGPEALAAYGISLFNRLFAGPLTDAFSKAWTTAQARKHGLRLRLRLDSDDPLLHRIPWELLHYDNGGGLAPPRPLATDSSVAFSRFLESAEPEGEPITHRPIRMLIALSEPHDLADWGLANFGKVAEQQDLESRFSPSRNSGQFSYDFLERASPQRLHQALEQGSIDGPEGESHSGYDILLYYGHALHHPERGARLLLEDEETGAGQLYDEEELIGRLQQLNSSGKRLSMVILIACNTAVTSKESSLGSMAANVVKRAGVPAVLAMQRLVEISLARTFTYHLSDRLLRHGIIDVAVSAARRLVQQAGSMGWSTPVLYMRNSNGRLFSPNAQLEYVNALLANIDFIRWRGPEFIELETLAVPTGQDWTLFRQRPEAAPPPVNALRTLRRAIGQLSDHPASNLIWLLGSPQSGQTILLKRLTIDLASQRIQDVNQRFGIFVSLTGYEQQRGSQRMAQHILACAKEIAPLIGDELVYYFVQSTRLHNGGPPRPRPRCVFILDGLDAIPEQERIDASREIGELTRQFPEQLFIVSCSEERFPGMILRNAQILLLQPLSERQIQQYLHNRNPERSTQLFRQIVENRLLTLTTDPALLSAIYQRMDMDPELQLTRNQLIQDYLDQALSKVAPRYALGDAARETLIALAWHARWQYCKDLPLRETFTIMRQVRGERDYSLEELYQMLSDARLLVSVGRHVVRFVHPALQAYCAALALHARPDFQARMEDIITMCSHPMRFSWWEDTLYALAGLMTDPVPLLSTLAAAIRAGSNIHALIAARCLEALPPDSERNLPGELRRQLLDACVLRLRSTREPAPERRAQIITALGRLRDPNITQELKRLLVERVRPSQQGMRYEYTNVRIAAARALRTMLSQYNGESTQTKPEQQRERQCAPEVLQQGSLVDDATLQRLMLVWQRGTDGRDALRTALKSPSAPVRAIAAFALGDLAFNLLDAKLLLRVILSPESANGEPEDERVDTMWAAADALTLFEPESIARLLTVLVKRRDSIPDASAQQLAYLAGRVRAQDEAVIDWLIYLLIANPIQSVKSKALQSLSWLGKDLPERRLPGIDGRPGPTLKQVIEQIALGRSVPPTALGPFTAAPNGEDEGKTPFYLRRKAIEALAWIGDQQTLQSLGNAACSWDLELREVWYATSAALEERLQHMPAKHWSELIADS